MIRALFVLLLAPMFACESAGPSEARAPDELRLSILRGTTLGGNVTLRADACRCTGDEYRMTGVQMATADGKEITAEAATLSTSSDEWNLTLSNVHVIEPGGLADTEQVVVTIPTRRG